MIKSIVNPDKLNGAIGAKINDEQKVFIDFFNSDSYKFWAEALNDLYN